MKLLSAENSSNSSVICCEVIYQKGITEVCANSGITDCYKESTVVYSHITPVETEEPCLACDKETNNWRLYTVSSSPYVASYLPIPSYFIVGHICKSDEQWVIYGDDEAQLRLGHHPHFHLSKLVIHSQVRSIPSQHDIIGT